MSCLSYLPFLVAVVAVTKADSTSTFLTAPKCPLPTKPLFLVADNQYKAYPDTSLYNADSVSLPLKCVSENYILREPVVVECVDKKWTDPNYECIALITLKRQVTDKIMIASGVVFGVTAAIFVIVKVVMYKRQRNKGDKFLKARAGGEGGRRVAGGPHPWDTRPENKVVFENDAYAGYDNIRDQTSFQPGPGYRGSSVYSDIDLGSRYSGNPPYTTQRL